MLVRGLAIDSVTSGTKEGGRSPGTVLFGFLYLFILLITSSSVICGMRTQGLSDFGISFLVSSFDISVISVKWVASFSARSNGSTLGSKSLMVQLLAVSSSSNLGSIAYHCDCFF